jgi:hypothetical protein
MEPSLAAGEMPPLRPVAEMHGATAMDPPERNQGEESPAARLERNRYSFYSFRDVVARRTASGDEA